MAKEDSLTVSNRTQIEQLKQMYIEHRELDAKSQVRFLFKGKELQNDFYVYSYDMADDCVIQVMLRQA